MKTLPARRLVLVVIRRLRRWLRPSLPPGSVKVELGGSGCYVRGLTADERREMLAEDPRPVQRERRWLDRSDRDRYRW